MTAILILICLIMVVIVAYIILFWVQIKHIKDQIEYVSQSGGQAFNEIQKIWDKIHDIKWVEIEPIKEQISELEQHASGLKPIPIVKQETRPVKRLESVQYIPPNLDLEVISPEYFKTRVAGEICNELKNYIVYEQTVEQGRKAFRGSIDIVIGGQK